MHGAGNLKGAVAQQTKNVTPLETPDWNCLKPVSRYGSTKYVEQNNEILNTYKLK